jgi:hypothetical protein
VIENGSRRVHLDAARDKHAMNIGMTGIWRFLDIGATARAHVEPFLELFKNPNFAPAVAAWMVYLAGLLVVVFALQVLRAAGRVSRVSRKIRRVKDAGAFVAEFQKIDDAVSRVGFLKHGWDEFKETFVPDAERNLVQNTVRPAEFLNLQDLGSSGLHLRWIQPLAGTFVAVGLLLTFTGLVGALLLASQSIGVDAVDAGAMRKMQEALVGLLGAATFKFWTSIAGLASSIILGLAYRFGTWWMQRALDRLCRELERCLVVLTPEVIAQRQLEELRQQALQLKEFNGQLAFTIGKGVEMAITATMPQVMTAALEPVAQQLQAVKGSLGQTNEAALKTMTADLGAALQGSAGKELNAVAGALSATSATLAEVGGQISGATGEFQETIRGMREAVEALSAQARNSAGEAQTTLQGQLKSTNETLTSLTRHISDAMAAVSANIRSSSEEAAASFAARIEASMTLLTDASDRNATALRAIVESIKDGAAASAGHFGAGAERAVEALSDAARRMADAVDKMMARVEQGSGAAVANLSSSLETAVRGMAEATRQNAAAITAAVSELAGAASAATDRVRADGDEIGRALSGKAVAAGSKAETIITEAAAGLGGVVDGFAGKVDGLAATLGEIETRMSSQVGALGDVTRATRETGTEMSKASQSVAAAAAPFERSGKVIADAAGAMALGIERSATTIVEAQAQARLLAESLARTLDRMEAVWRSYDERFAGVDEALAKTMSSIIDNFRANAETVKDFVNEIDSALGAAVERFAGNIEELQDTAKMFAQSTDALAAAARDIGGQPAAAAAE